MPNDMIRYDLLVQEALCGVVKKVLGDVAKNGLPGDHHFYITFRTHAPGVRLSSRMRELYPDEMTIILQHQFENLKVTEQALEVGLSFKGIPEILLIPFDALTGFFDPSVQFSAKFEPHTDFDESVDDQTSSMPLPTKPSLLSAVPHQANGSSDSPREKELAAAGGDQSKVVSIDSFRKKP
jgi:Uncharacterized protein conserved in bacteria